jgi:hypothetical protein
MYILLQADGANGDIAVIPVPSWPKLLLQPLQWIAMRLPIGVRCTTDVETLRAYLRPGSTLPSYTRVTSAYPHVLDRSQCVRSGVHHLLQLDPEAGSNSHPGIDIHQQPCDFDQAVCRSQVPSRAADPEEGRLRRKAISTPVLVFACVG